MPDNGGGRMGKTLVFSSSQAANYLGVSQETIRRWCRSGSLPHHRTPGGMLRFSRAQLDGFTSSLRHEGIPGNGHPAALEAARKR